MIASNKTLGPTQITLPGTNCGSDLNIKALLHRNIVGRGCMHVIGLIVIAICSSNTKKLMMNKHFVKSHTILLTENIQTRN